MKVFDREGWRTHLGSVTGEPWPDCYLHVLECRSGDEWICPIRGNEILSLEKLVGKWVKALYAGSGYTVKVVGLTARVGGEYYAKIMTDGRNPNSAVCWDGAGFYLEVSE